MPSSLAPWSTTAVNLPEHATNPVHTNDGARIAGFEAALVAGTTTHAYLTHPAAAAWGDAWLDHGWSELRLLAPVFDGVTVDLVPIDNERIEAQVNGSVRATLAVALQPPAQPAPAGANAEAPIETHEPFTIDLRDGSGTYGLRAGDDLEIYRDTGRAHPAVWSTIGNTVTMRHYVDGPWVHVRSAITHLGPVTADAELTIESALIDRFDSRAGERVLIEVVASVGDTAVARIDHESIVRLR